MAPIPLCTFAPSNPPTTSDSILRAEFNAVALLTALREIDRAHMESMVNNDSFRGLLSWANKGGGYLLSSFRKLCEEAQIYSSASLVLLAGDGQTKEGTCEMTAGILIAKMSSMAGLKATELLRRAAMSPDAARRYLGGHSANPDILKQIAAANDFSLSVSLSTEPFARHHGCLPWHLQGR